MRLGLLLLTITYFALTYSIAVIIIVALWLKVLKRDDHEKLKGVISERSKSGVFLTAVILLILPLAPYIQVWVQTVLYARILTPTVNKALSINYDNKKVSSLRVLSITARSAKVYVITPCSTSPSLDQNKYVGQIINISRHDDQWQYTGDYDVVWSDCGNADGNTFPPYPTSGFTK